jgi:hypothetical protein
MTTPDTVTDGNKPAHDRQARRFHPVLDKRVDHCQYGKLGVIVVRVWNVPGLTQPRRTGCYRG